MSNKARHTYIGSYDAGCILNFNPYRPRILVYEEKRAAMEGAPPKDIDNPHIRRGNAMEPIIEAYMKEIDPTINSPAMFAKYDAEGKDGGGSITGTDNQIFMSHPRLPYVGGHPDGIGESCYYEFKAPTQRKTDWIKESNLDDYTLVEALRIGAELSMEELYETGVPPYWLVQVQHGLFCTGLPRGELVIWDYDRWEPLRIPVLPDKALHEQMEIEYEIFWNNLQMGIPPQGDDPVEIQYCEIIEDEYLDELLADYLEAMSSRYDGKEVQSERKAQILSYVGDREMIITPNHTAHISYVNRGTWGYYRITVKDRHEND